MRISTQTEVVKDLSLRYLFIEPSDKDQIKAIHRILFRCGIHMARHFLFHWLPPYPKRAIRRDCNSKAVVIVREESSNEYTSTFQMWKGNEQTLQVGKIATDPKYWGKGIGKANMLFMEKYARGNGYDRIDLEVYSKSNKAISFYEHLGYRIIGTKRSIRFKVFIMEKCLP